MDFETWWREHSNWFTDMDDDDLCVAEKALAYNAWSKAMEIADGEIDELREEIVSLEIEIDNMTIENGELEEELACYNEIRNNLEQELEQLETECAELQARLEEVSE